MGRPERPLDPAAGPVQAFAAALRKLRQEAGNPKYLQMQRLTGRSRTALAEAAGGDRLPTWETVEAYVKACGADPVPWEAHWEAVRDAIRPQPAQLACPDDGSPGEVPAQPRPARLRFAFRPGLAATGIAAAAALIVAYLAGGMHTPGRVASQSAGRAAGPQPIVVQNMIATGSSGISEDSTPAYLSARAVPACSRYHCEIPGTQMWSGTPLEATCTVKGAEMTNENTLSPGIAQNKNGIFSALWYRCILTDGHSGYLSEVYVSPADRGGLGLPTCQV